MRSKLVSNGGMLRATSAFCLLLLLLLPATASFSQTADVLLKRANALFDGGKEDSAKNLYARAAAMGNADAHYALAYRYVGTPAIYHYAKAAAAGHGEAMRSIFDELFFRSSSLTVTNPQAALAIYRQGKAANPAMEFYGQEGAVDILQKAAEAPPFDAQAFIRKYHIGEKDTSDFYAVWTLAEEAARGGRFGKPDPELIFQLVLRGGDVPAEKDAAVADAYAHWKRGAVLKFNICSYVTSGIGMSYCASKASDATEADLQKQIATLAASLPDTTAAMLRSGYKTATAFLREKAMREEGHGGSGRGAWMLESLDSQKIELVELIARVQKGYKPKLSEGKDYDLELNQVYKTTMQLLRSRNPEPDLPTADDLRAVQRLWLKYRDTGAELFHRLNPAVSVADWARFLTAERAQQIKWLAELGE